MFRFKTLQNVTLIAVAVVFAFLLISTFQRKTKSDNNSQSNSSPLSGARKPSHGTHGSSPMGGGNQEGGKREDFGVPHWVAANSGMPLPPGSIQGGFDLSANPRQPALLYICRAELLGGVWPGHVFAGTCYVGWDGREFVMSSYEMLVGSGTEWRTPVAGFVGALVGGQGNRQEKAYICRVEFQNYGIQVGYAVNDTCNIGFWGKEYALPQPFEVLYPTAVQEVH